MKVLSQLLGIHRNTLRYKLKEMGLYHRFSNLTDIDLDLLIKVYKQLRPNSGIRYTIGFLHRHGLHIQKERVRKSLQRIDGLGHALRRHDALLCHEYISTMSNAVWHFDGLHKLIQYGFVIHGGVDGHDHMVSKLMHMK
jgi:Bacterial regulatory protein, Fis family